MITVLETAEDKERILPEDDEMNRVEEEIDEEEIPESDISAQKQQYLVFSDYLIFLT